MERNFFEHEAYFESEGDGSLKQKWKSMSSSSLAFSENGGNDCFDCNICLDSADEPVVTLCGHLFCWPCIYKWLRVKSSSPDVDQQQPDCPVCKASISSSTLVPLYGRGKSSSDSETKKPSQDIVIPPRPLHSGSDAANTNSPRQNRHHQPNFFQSQSGAFHRQQYFPTPYGGYSSMTSSNVEGITTTNIISPMIGMFGELMFARTFGASETGLFSYPYYPFMGSNNPRIRRQEMQLEKSLNRVSIFLLCCIVLCLLLF